MIREDKEGMAGLGEATGQSDKPPAEKIGQKLPREEIFEKIGDMPPMEEISDKMPRKHSAGEEMSLRI